jgi:methyl-galactoside transport system substrate-binding protein
MKKIIALVLALMIIMSMTACGAKPAETTPAAPAATEAAAAATEAAAEPAGDVKTYKVGVAIYQYNDNFMTLYRQEIENYFKTLETDTVKYEVTMVDGKNDMGEQTNQIDTFITQKMDVIICNLVQTSSAEVIIDKVVAAGIPLVLINREPLGDAGDESYPGIINNPTVCYVGADARQSGTYQGEIVLALPNKGDINGDGVVSYVMVVGDPENPDAQYRTEYSIKALTDAGVQVKELVKNVGNWDQTKGQEIVAAALTQYGDEIEVVFCNNDGMALGAAAAIEAAGRKVGEDIYLLGVDALDECQEMVQKGTMTGTVLNDHIGQSHKAVDVAIQALNGEPIDNYYWVDYVKVDASYFG